MFTFVSFWLFALFEKVWLCYFLYLFWVFQWCMTHFFSTLPDSSFFFVYFNSRALHAWFWSPDKLLWVCPGCIIPYFRSYLHKASQMVMISDYDQSENSENKQHWTVNLSSNSSLTVHQWSVFLRIKSKWKQLTHTRYCKLYTSYKYFMLDLHMICLIVENIY